MDSKNHNIFSLNLTILRFFGCWPRRNATLAYNLYGLIMIMCHYVFYTITLFLSLTRSNILEDITASLFMSLTFLAMAPKYWIFLTKRSEIRTVINEIKSFKIKVFDDENIVENVDRNQKKGKFGCMLLFYLAIMALLSYYATPLIDLDARRLPFLAWYVKQIVQNSFFWKIL